MKDPGDEFTRQLEDVEIVEDECLKYLREIGYDALNEPHISNSGTH